MDRGGGRLETVLLRVDREMGNPVTSHLAMVPQKMGHRERGQVVTDLQGERSLPGGPRRAMDDDADLWQPKCIKADYIVR